jgi:hypothetical protein
MPDPCVVIDARSAQQAMGQAVQKAENLLGASTSSRDKVWTCKWVGLATGRSVEINLWGLPRSVAMYMGQLAWTHRPQQDVVPPIGATTVAGVPGEVVTAADSAEFLAGRIFVRINVAYAHGAADYGHHVSQTLAPAVAAYLARWSEHEPPYPGG